MRRLGVALLLLGLCLLPPSLSAQTRHQSFIDFLGIESRSAQAYTLWYTPNGYEWLGGALSASSNKFWFNLGLAPFVQVRWYMVWQPLSSTYSGCELVAADNGPVNIVQIVEITGSTTPIGQSTANAIDITAQMETLRLAGVAKQIIMRCRGGVNGLIVHKSVLDIVTE